LKWVPIVTRFLNEHEKLGDSAQRLQGLDHLLHPLRCQLHSLFDSLFQSPDAVRHMFDLVQVVQQRVLLGRLLKVHLLFDSFLILLHTSASHGAAINRALEPAWTAEVECRLSDDSRLIAFLLQQSHGIQ